MRWPLGLVLHSAKHFIGRKLHGKRKFPLALTLDPLGGLAHTNGRGKNGAPETVAGRTMLSVAQCLAAMEECKTPIVLINGGEPLEYPEIAALTRSILRSGKYLFLCTNGTLIRQRLHMIPPVNKFFWSVRLQGTESVHDARCGVPGQFAAAMDGIKAAKNAGSLVVVTSTIGPKTDVADLEALYRQLHAMHVDGYTVAPHYPAEKLCRDGSAKFHEKMQQRFREANQRLGAYNLMISPLYFEYLRGERELDCSVWASPVYGPQGWSGPCYLQNAQFAKSYQGLLQETVWENYGRGLNPRCENCQCPSGFETAAMLGRNAKAGDFWKMLAWQFGGTLGERREGKRSA